MIKELTEKEYKSTMTGKMVDITETAEPVVDIWPFVQMLKKEKVVLDYVYENELVENVYRNTENSFHHVLLPTDNKNIFIVIIIDVTAKDIKGHFCLDLNREYGQA
jgi:hypothetical protein